MSKYADIIERLEKADGPDHVLDAHILCALYGYEMHKDSDPATGVFSFWQDGICHNCSSWMDPTASLDAAVALVEKMLPGWVFDDVSQNARLVGNPWGCSLSSYDGSDFSKNRHARSGWDYASPQIAVLVALFRALEAKEAA